MRPIRIISHAACEHPGYLCDYLERRGMTYENIRGDSGEDIAAGLDGIAGLVFLGAPVSVYDPPLWIEDEVALLRAALEQALPVLGICFGAHLLARALDAVVCVAPEMQVGWHPVELTAQAKTLFAGAGLPERFEAFEWHGDTYETPARATPLFVGDCIRNQGFVYGNSLALQFHPEITASMIEEWLERYASCFEQPSHCIQDKALMLAHLDERLTTQRAVADALFAWWLGGLNDERKIHEPR